MPSELSAPRAPKAKLSLNYLLGAGLVPVLFAAFAIGCSSDGGSPNDSGTGGSTPGNGGTSSSGGATSSSGGATALGGTNGSGGSSSGGAASGGANNGGSSAGGSGSGGPSGGSTASGGSDAKGGAASGGSNSGRGGRSGSGGGTSGGTSSATGGSASSGGAASGGSGGATTTDKFSFFVTSLAAIRSVSGKQDGFGGDLRFGESTGLAGADKICTTIAESSMPGSGAKGWRAFLSTTTVNAIDRVGTGPWYDRKGRLVAQNTQGLLSTRPMGDNSLINDLPNENGVPNRAGTGTGMDDNHDTITGTNTSGKWDGGSTCNDWTSATGSNGPRVGHSWPAGSGMSWIQAHTAPGCEPSVALVQMGAGSGSGIGNGGGYGGFYCFALKP